MTITLQPKASPGHHIIGLDSEHLNGGTVPWHKHLYAQLLYPAEGVVRIWAGESVWLVHASSALWLPPQMPHKFVATGNVLLKTVLVSEAESETLGKDGYSLTKIAHRLGYASAESFGNMFKRRTGYSPGKFTRRLTMHDYAITRQMI